MHADYSLRKACMLGVADIYRCTQAPGAPISQYVLLFLRVGNFWELFVYE